MLMVLDDIIVQISDYIFNSPTEIKLYLKLKEHIPKQTNIFSVKAQYSPFQRVSVIVVK